ncbi:MAG: hypothetical protein KAT16_03710 [Candidatus Heimdallarchaeota archaeon]|nr:hypothetical protein [Candidatus Heimdallarchaeota archaeon]
MGRNLEDQMRLSMRGILSKQMTGGGDKNQVIASFVSDDNGFPLTGMKRSEKSIVEMSNREFEQICAIIPQIWESVVNSTDDMEILSLKAGSVNHITIGFMGKKEEEKNIEMLITRLEELYITSLYLSKK